MLIRRLTLATLLAALPLSSSAHAQERSELRIAMVVDGAGAVPEETARAIEAQLGELSPRPVRVVSRSVGDWTPETARRHISEAQSRDDIDLVVAVGPLVARASAQARELARPVFAALVADPSLHGLPAAADDERPIGYRRDLLALEPDLERVRPMLPGRRVAVALDASVAPGLENLGAFLARASRELGITLVPWPVDASDPTAGLPDDVDAVHSGLLLSLDRAGRRAWIEALRARGVAVVAGVDPSAVEDGALISRLPDRIAMLRGRRLALDVVAHLDGAPLSSLRGPLAARDELRLNTATARALGLSPPFELLLEAVAVGGSADAEGPRITLVSAIEEALARSFALEADRQRLRAGDARLRQQLAPLLPQLAATADAIWIDEDRGAGPFPPSERTLSGGLLARQVLFSADRLTAFTAEEAAQSARGEELQVSRLDLVAATSAAYLRVLRTHNAELAQRENLQNVQANLRVAEMRERVGSAGREDVLRSRIEAAGRLRDLVRAIATREQAQIAMNQILARPPEAPFHTGEATLAELPLLGSDPRIARYFQDPAAFGALRRYAAREGLETSPERRALVARMDALRRRRGGRLMSFFLPDIELQAGLTNRFWMGGAGSQAPGGDVGFPIPDSLDWSVGVFATLPLFDGGGRIADVERLDAELAALDAEVRELDLAIEARVRSAMHAASASFAAIGLTEEAALAAQENLELVTAGYQNGTLDIIRLIDAQTQHLVSRLAAVDARYDFALQMVDVERALGRFSVGPESRSADAFYRDLSDVARATRGRTGDRQ